MRTQLLAAAALLALPALAQSQSAQRGIDIRFRNMDQNGDRVITRQEWRGSDRSFRVHDWNGDGVLSGEEIRPGASRGETDFDPAEPYNNWTARAFSIIDQNRDGRITRGEWRFEPEAFARADRNRDGILSRAEFLGEAVDDDRGDRFDYLDSDNNGRVERDEWHGGRQDFEWLDRNNDGVLSRSEVVGAAEEGSASDSFANLDSNRNGSVTFNEWPWSRASFDRRDRNRDGIVSRAEFGSGVAGTSGVADNVRETVIVPSTERWTDSGIVVRRGDSLIINASGTVTMSGPEDSATPEGSRTGRRALEAPLPQESAGGLVMRVANSQPVFVGGSRTVQAPADGRVYFTVNDDFLQDNRGEFRVTVRVNR
jgi:Ca2+-binding EF-hand superfamily protein